MRSSAVPDVDGDIEDQPHYPCGVRGKRWPSEGRVSASKYLVVFCGMSNVVAEAQGLACCRTMWEELP